MTDDDRQCYEYRITVAVYADSGEEADQVLADWLAACPHPMTSFPSVMKEVP